MDTFDPIRWFERIIPARLLHRIIRWGGMAAASGFLLRRVRQYSDYTFKPLWLAETAIYVVVAIAFYGRHDPTERSHGVTEIIVPLIGSVLPFGLLITRPSRWVFEHTLLTKGIFLWMTVSTIFTVWSMWALRRSFSITVEARPLVTRGPYRFVRHPIYFGEMLTTAAVVVWRWSPVNVAIFMCFVAIQLWRARKEEVKLANAFPFYQAAVGRSWWIWRRPARNCGEGTERPPTVVE